MWVLAAHTYEYICMHCPNEHQIFPLLFAATKLFNWKSSMGNFKSTHTARLPSVSSTKIQFKSNFPHMRAVCHAISITESSLKRTSSSCQMQKLGKKKWEHWRALIRFVALYTYNVLYYISIGILCLVLSNVRFCCIFSLWFTDQQIWSTRYTQCSLAFNARNV